MFAILILFQWLVEYTLLISKYKNSLAENKLINGQLKEKITVLNKVNKEKFNQLLACSQARVYEKFHRDSKKIKLLLQEMARNSGLSMEELNKNEQGYFMLMRGSWNQFLDFYHRCGKESILISDFIVSDGEQDLSIYLKIDQQ